MRPDCKARQHQAEASSGWVGHTRQADTRNLRRLISKNIERYMEVLGAIRLKMSSVLCRMMKIAILKD